MTADWFARRTYAGTDFPLERLLELKADSISLVLPAREVADLVGAVLDMAMPLSTAGLLDEVVVVDAGSTDGTARVAAARGARVVQENTVHPELGPCRGKGDAMWRSLAATSGAIVVFVDADTADPRTEHILGLVGPLLADPDIAFVKGAYERPFQPEAGPAVPHGGGRVTELAARPALNLHFPELAGFVQPLAGEVAARRDLLERIPFAVGYGVEVAMLIDALRTAGLDRLAQTWLGTRQNRHQPLRELGPMAYAVLAAIERRAEARGDGPPDAARYLRPTLDRTLEEVTIAVGERPPALIARSLQLRAR